MENTLSDNLVGTYEEEFMGYEVYIDHNRDIYRGGFEWTICKDGEELDDGLAFSVQDSLDEARNAVRGLMKTINTEG
jgi:hypothetical protein